MRRGLHVTLAPAGRSLRVVVWRELPQPPGAVAVTSGPRTGLLAHPWVDHEPPPWLPPQATPIEIAVELPRLASGGPLPLPGLVDAWDTSRLRPEHRKVSTGLYVVAGWALPVGLSLSPLRALLALCREMHGEGALSPTAMALLHMLRALEHRLREGPLLPALWMPGSRPEALSDMGSSSGGAIVGWVPPVDLPSLLSWHRRLAEIGSSGAQRVVRAERRSCVSIERPSSFGWFVVDLLAAAGGYLDEPHDEVALRAALEVGDASVVSLHEAHQSALYPTHPLLSPPSTPPGALEARISSRAGRIEASLSLTHRGARLPVGALVEADEPRAPLLQHEGQAWVRPASAVERDLSAGVAEAGWLFCRPEVLALGKTVLGEVEADALLAKKSLRAGVRSLQGFLAREGAARQGGSHTFLTCVSDASGDVRVRVDFAPIGDPTAWLAGASLFDDVRFVAQVALSLDDERVSVDEAERLLASGSSGLVRVGSRLLSRASLSAAVALARAREKVLQKLERGGLSLRQVVDLEDTLATDDDACETAFAASWSAFVERLASGDGLPEASAPAWFSATLRPYQQRGLSWMAFLLEHGLGGCLADDMGLGKTVQVLALLSARKASRRRGQKAPASLVVCPTAVVHNWLREAARFAPRLRVVAHHGPARPQTQGAFAKLLRGADLLVTSYPLVRLDEALFADARFDVLVADEAQQIKNPDARQTRALKAVGATARLALTGTPVENDAADLWSIFDLVTPGLLGGRSRFSRAYALPIRAGNAAAAERLRRRVAPFMLRRNKALVAADLPEKQEQDIYCELSAEQRSLYVAMAEAASAGLADRQGMARRAHVLSALTSFKQICDHPECFERERPHDLEGRSGKLDRLLELLAELLAEGQPALLFTQFVRMGELLAAAIEERFDVEAPFYHGGLSASARQAMVDAFSSDDGPPLLIVSLRAGGSGLNLTRATAVIHYDRWWNPAVEDQATDRAHRIGQTRRVNVFRMTTVGTVEERVASLIDEKRALSGDLVGASDEAWLTEMSDEQLRGLFGLGEGPR